MERGVGSPYLPASCDVPVPIGRLVCDRGSDLVDVAHSFLTDLLVGAGLSIAKLDECSALCYLDSVIFENCAC